MILQGDAMSVLKTIPSESVQCVVTSPPYYGLRDYGVDGQIGLEDTPQQYVNNLAGVFDEVKRVLKSDGTLWVNIGDSYAAQRGGTHPPAETLAGGKHGKTDTGEIVNRGRSKDYNPTRNASAIGLKHKDLIGIPWMLAFELRCRGWYLRQDIIWHKPNPMPESVRDRCTKSHEYIFLLSKSSKYYFDADAIKEPTVTKDNLLRDRDSTKMNNTPGRTRMGGLKRNNYGMRNKRDVWSVSTKPYSGAHFATYPEELIRPCILAGRKEGDTVLDPFSGAATTGVVCLKNRREFIGIELNREYVLLLEERLADAKEKIEREKDQYRLFDTGVEN